MGRREDLWRRLHLPHTPCIRPKEDSYAHLQGQGADADRVLRRAAPMSAPTPRSMAARCFNCTIDKYVRCMLKPTGADGITIRSLDLEEVSRNTTGRWEGRLALPQAVLDALPDVRGVEVTMFFGCAARQRTGLVIGAGRQYAQADQQRLRLTNRALRAGRAGLPESSASIWVSPAGDRISTRPPLAAWQSITSAASR